jgi:flagellar motor switch protein FliN
VDNQSNKKAAEWFSDRFVASFAESLTKAVGTAVAITRQENSDFATRQERTVHFCLTAGGALSGQCYVEMYESDVATFGSSMLGSSSPAFSDEHADALAKAIASAMPALTASLSAERGEVTFKVHRVADLAFGGMLVVPLSASMPEQPALPILLYFDGDLVTALTPRPAGKSAAGAGNILFDPTNLKLVMDVELAMSLRFGQRQMPLREVLELASGSVIELDRHVDDPVELLLDGKVIARGEAVIVDGNYALRITEVPQPIASHLGR